MGKKELSIIGLIIMYTGFIFAGFSYMLRINIQPIKENQVRMEVEIKEVKTKLNQLLSDKTASAK